jgi:transcriptional regulator with AAA-type ATPase domain
MPANFDDLYQLFYVAAYGCNRQCQKEIKNVFAIHRQETPFLFFEYFLTQSLPKHIDEKEWGSEWDKAVHVLAPFAPRLVEHSVAISDYKSTDAVRLTIRNISAFQKLRLSFRWDHSALTMAGWRKWSGSIAPRLEPPVVLNWANVSDSQTPSSYKVGLIKGWSLKWQIDKYTRSLDEFSRRNGYALAGLFQARFPDEKLAAKKIPSIFVPIASTRLFYGGVWVMLPGLSDSLPLSERPAAIENFQRILGLRIAQIIDRTYLPVLALLHEHWLEHLHADSLKEEKILRPITHRFATTIPASTGTRTASVSFYNVFPKLNAISGTVNDGRRTGLVIADDLEELFRQLWERRASGKCWSLKEAFEQSLAFKGYLVCSESMVQLLHKVVKQASSLRKSNDTLPGCLVVGGAGSGKEKLAKMLRLFSDTSEDNGYCDGKEHVVNLAAIRPAPVTAAIMAGFETKGSKDIKLLGILSRVREESKGGPPPTLRLDEFNSMDPDSQGVLLRFMDNSEIVPLGALADADKDGTDCLVVGIMNEDPQDISRERAMEFFRSGEYLGSFLGDLLYEHFLKIRRLRPDVMYRMIRNGKFVIPPLRDRSEDVPLLLHVFVRDELRDSAEPNPKLHLTLECLECLTSPVLLWPGNVRQLQALGKLIAEALRRVPKIDEWHVVTLQILETALREIGLMRPQQ